LRTEKASDTLYFDKQQGNEIFLDQYGHLNTDTSSYDSKTMD
jgi:hypothetical protein